MDRNTQRSIRLRGLATLGMAALLCAPAAAAGWDDELAAEIERVVPAMVDVRHDLHQHPELSNREHETAAKVAAHLEALGLEVRTGIAHTGVVAILEGGRPGPTIAVRADIDALPVTEDSGLPYASTVRTEFGGKEVGVAHACGHDIHTSVGLGVASVLTAMADELPGRVAFVFQPAEEGPPPGEEGGAELMLEEGLFDWIEPREIYGLHSWPGRDVGEVELAAGPTFASVDRFYARVVGQQSHGAYPHQGHDPIVMASQAVLAFQTIPSRTLDPREPAVVTVGVFQAGERYNIIPGEVRLAGTVRAYRESVQDTVERRLHEILRGITSAGGGSYELEYERVTPATVNDADLHARAMSVLEAALGAERVHIGTPTMGGEDFAFFARRVPGYYFRLGTLAPGGTSGGLHTPDFRADDGAIEVGIRAMTSLVLDALHRSDS